MLLADNGKQVSPSFRGNFLEPVNERCISNSVEDLRWSFFAKVVND